MQKGGRYVPLSDHALEEISLGTHVVYWCTILDKSNKQYMYSKHSKYQHFFSSRFQIYNHKILCLVGSHSRGNLTKWNLTVEAIKGWTIIRLKCWKQIELCNDEFSWMSRALSEGRQLATITSVDSVYVLNFTSFT